jgi:hypothetical protein
MTGAVAQPALQLMIGDKELRAIGHVAAQWAYLETQLDGVANILMHQPSTKALGLKLDQSFKRRMETLRKAAKLALDEEPNELGELLLIANDASSLRGLRDDIVHGHWKLHREPRQGLTTGIRVYSQRPVLKVRNLAFSADKAESVAVKLAKTNVRLIFWCMRNIPQR